MLSASPFPSARGSRSGLVLVVVLALIALLSILIVAFISFNKLSKSASYSYSKQIQAQEIAHGGLEDILNDLHTEIVAGSTTQNSSAEASSGTYSPVYVPNTNWTAQPARLGFASSAFGTDINSTNAAGQYLLPPTFVRESKASQDGTSGHFISTTLSSTYGYSGTLPINRASAASTTNASPNGRSVSLARWAETDLLSTNASSSFLPTPFVTNAPDWVYVTRAGSRACILSDLPNMTNAPLTGAPTGTTTASPVVGRYAYVVYDEGALLDVNAAGLISSATNSFATLTNYPGTNAPANSFKDPATGIAQVSTGKTYSAYANLTQLPGFSATGGQTALDNLIKWRNGSVNLSAANGAGTNFYQAAFSYAKSGFLNFQTASTGTDSPILNRQDLINYFTKIDPNINTTSATFASALPYLGTFSRAANAPSWHPTTDSGTLSGYYALANPNGYTFITTNPTTGATQFGKVGYKTNQESSTDGTTDAAGNSTANANRDIPNVRWAVAGTVIHYNDDGTYYTYKVNIGDPVVQHRFSLAKIAWLSFTNSSTGLSSTSFNSALSTTQEQSAIKDCFGLQWDAQQLGLTAVAPHLTGPHFDCWDYYWNAGSSLTSDVHILTLGDIANGVTSATSTNYYREPNFFEMLKAGILSGSLGQTSGPLCSGGNFEGTHGYYLEVYYTEKNRHVLQIGANIIDQFDSDSIPTAIYMATSGTSKSFWSTTIPEIDLAYNTVYGDENLPGITRVYQNFLEDWYDTTNKVGYIKSWIVPELWNIHQAPPTGIDMTFSGNPGYPHPTEFRVHGYGVADWDVVANGGSGLPTGVSGVLAPPMNWDFATPVNTYPYHDATTGFAGTGTPAGTASTVVCAQLPTVNTGAVTAATATTPANYAYFKDVGSSAYPGSAYSPFYRFPDYLQMGNLFSGFAIPGTFPTGGPFLGTHPLCAWSAPTATNPPDLEPPAENNGAANGGTTLVEFVGLFAGEKSCPDLTSYPGTTMQYNLSPGASGPLYFAVECQDPTTLNWHPCNWITSLSNTGTTTGSSYPLIGDNAGGVPASPNQNYVGTPGTGHVANGQTFSLGRGGAVVRTDPRTDRFSMMVERMYWDQKANTTMYSGPGAMNDIEDNFPNRKWGFVYTPDQGASPGIFGAGGDTYAAWWAVNLATTTTKTTFYVDPDGVVRPGDSYRENTATGDGCLLYHGCQGGGGPPSGGPPSSTSTLTIATSLLPTTYNSANTSVPVNSGQARRPLVLNRPFRNVGELGYTFRDLPFKTIDFFSQYSGDTALLDLFSVTDEPAVTGGQINVSNAPASTLSAILTGATKQEINPQYSAKYDNGASGITANYPTGVSASTGAPNFIYNEASSISSQLASSFSASGPIGNRADLVARLDPIIGTPTTAGAAASTYASTSLIGQGYLDYANKAVAEAPIRALSGVTSTRTWNLLIDIIAQSGQMSPTAQTLNDFIVQGERRYWLHIAIDRYTGRVIDQQLEPVYE